MEFAFLAKKNTPFCLTAVFLLFSLGSLGQDTPPGSLTAGRPTVNLFVHLDKSIYQPKETLWFTGYILNRDVDLMMAQNTLYVVLVDPVSKSVIAKQRFLIHDGFGKGSLQLPDSVAAGDYWFLAYTNALLETGDQPVFRQLISVRTGEPAPFRISSTKLEERDDSLFVRYKISTANSGLASGGKFVYTLYDSTNILRTSQQIIDPFGEVVLYLGPKQDTGKYRELAVTISRGEFSKRFFFPVYTGRPIDLEPSTQTDTSGIDVKITPKSKYYQQRSLVTLTIRIQNQAGRPLPSIFSLSVVASRRMGPIPPHNITWYDHFPISTPSSISQLKQYAGDMPDYGYVLEDEDKVSKPVNLALMGTNFASFQTDAKGRFALPYAALVSSQGEVNCLSVAAKSPDRYKIMVYSRADTFDKQLAAFHYPITSPNYEIAPDPEDLVQQASMKFLKAAVVKATIQNDVDDVSGYYNSTHCETDYVCTHHHGPPGWPDILNCPYMRENGRCDLVKPKEGALYYIVPPAIAHQKVSAIKPIIYHCKVPPVPHFMKVLEPIYRESPFPVPYTAHGEFIGSGLQSTLFWNHGLTTNANGELEVSFYTDNLTGNFTCSLQGVSSAGVISGSSTFTVVPPNQTATNTPIENSNLGGNH
jgi:hypothetical protein